MWNRFSDDCYCCSTNSPEEFIREIGEMENNTGWVKANVKEMTVAPDPGRKSGLLLNCCPLRKIAYPSLYERAHIGGTALGKLSAGDLSRVLNLCLQTSDKDSAAQLVICGERISAVHSGEYVRLPAKEIFQSADSILRKRFSGTEFRSGYLDHRLAAANYEIGDERISARYGKILEPLGASAAVTVETSNVGLSGVQVLPEIVQRGISFIIGKSLTVKHQGRDATMEKVRENANMTWSLINQSILSFGKMKEIPIQYPIPCYCNVAKRIGVPKKLAMAALEDYKTAVDGKLLSNALELYTALTGVLVYAKYDKISWHGMEDLKETVGRALTIRFSDYDIPETEWHMKKSRGYVPHAA